MNRRALSAVAILLAVIAISQFSRTPITSLGGRSVNKARLVTDSELERISQSLHFFLALGADENFNYYQLREWGYFKTSRDNGQFDLPQNSKFELEAAPIGSGGTFITIVNGKYRIPDPSVLTEENIAAFGQYLPGRESSHP